MNPNNPDNYPNNPNNYPNNPIESYQKHHFATCVSSLPGAGSKVEAPKAKDVLGPSWKIQKNQSCGPQNHPRNCYMINYKLLYIYIYTYILEKSPNIYAYMMYMIYIYIYMI